MRHPSPPRPVRARWWRTRSAATLPPSIRSPIRGFCPPSGSGTARRPAHQGCRRRSRMPTGEGWPTRLYPRGPHSPDPAPSEGTLSARHDRQGAPENFEIEEQGPVPDVLGIQSHHLFEIHDITAPAHLPQPGNARLDSQASEVTVLIVREIALEKRPRAHQRHLADQDVPQLRQLIEAPAPQQLSQSSHPRIVGNLEEPFVSG